MIELRPADWPRSVAWYRDMLGLGVERTDEAGGFALLKAGAARIALKAGGGPGPGRGGVRLTFRVEDVDVERARLVGLGVEVAGPIDVPAERYRRIELADPDGTPITLFAWSG